MIYSNEKSLSVMIPVVVTPSSIPKYEIMWWCFDIIVESNNWGTCETGELELQEHPK